MKHNCIAIKTDESESKLTESPDLYPFKMKFIHNDKIITILFPAHPKKMKEMNILHKLNKEL